MKERTRRRGGLFRTAETRWWTMLLPSLLLGCGDAGREPTCVPCGQTGWIEGQVLSAGSPFGTSVRATGLQAGSIFPLQFERFTDADGNYRLQVPVGTYLLACSDAAPTAWSSTWLSGAYYSSHGLQTEAAQADTLHVSAAGEPLRADFHFGRVRVQTLVSAAFAGQRARFVLRGRRGLTGEAEAEWQGNQASSTFASCLPGRYLVGLVARSGAWPFTPLLEELWPDSITVGTDTAETHDLPLAESPASLTGHVRGSWQAMGCYAPEVSLFSMDSTLVVSRTADAEGSFSFTTHVPRQVRVRVRIPLKDPSSDVVDVCAEIYGMPRWIGGPTFSEATVFELVPGETIPGVDLEESGVLFTLDGDVSPRWDGARIMVMDAEGRLVGTNSYLLNRSHLVGLPNLPPGTYRFRFEPYPPLTQGWQAQWYDHGISLESATPVTVSRPGEVVPLRVSLKKGGSVSGRVRFPGGRIVPRQTVHVWDADTRSCLGLVEWLDETGSFQAQGLVDGHYKIGVQISPEPGGSTGCGDCPPTPPARILWYPGTTEWEMAARIGVQDHADVTGITIDLP